MKFLKYFLLVIVILTILFFAKGFLTPEIYYENEIQIDKPVKEVWAGMSDESRVSEWIEGIKKMEHVSGTPNTVGAVSKIYIEENGQEMVMEETITKLVTNELMAMTFTMDFMNMDYEASLSEKDGKTTLKTKSTTVGNGMFAKSMVSFMKTSMKSQEDKNLSKLKKIIEENTKNYFPEPKAELGEEVQN